PELVLMTGNEFRCIDSLARDYDGFMLGGAVVNSVHLRRTLAAWTAGDEALAASLDAEMQELMYKIYGGTAIACWLAGLKYLLVRLGVFSTTANLLGYELTEECRREI